MDRRTALLVIGSAGVGGYFAERELGYLAKRAEDEQGNTATATATDNATPRQTATPTGRDEPGDVDDPTPADTEPSIPTAEVNETFELGNVEYRVRGAWQADELGRASNPVRPAGQFVVVSVRVENNRNDLLSFPGSIFRLRQSNSWQYPGEQATEAAVVDDRVQLDGWLDESIASSNGRSGVSAFDVDPSDAAALWFLSPDDGQDVSVLVPIGRPSQLDFLQ